MYWIARADAISGTLWFGTLLWACACITLWLVWGWSGGKLSIRPAVWATVVHFILLCGACIMPTSKDIAIMVVIPKIFNSDIPQGIPTPLLDLANEWIKDKLMEDK